MPESWRSIDAWLAHLRGTLCRFSPVALVRTPQDAGAYHVQWSGQGAEGLPVVAQSPADASCTTPGWLVSLPGSQPAWHAIFLGGPGRSGELDHDVALAASICRIGWKLRDPAAKATVARDELQDAMHALRNGLNSVAMTGAVLAAAPLPPPLMEFAADLDSAVKRSLASLVTVAALVR